MNSIVECLEIITRDNKTVVGHLVRNFGSHVSTVSGNIHTLSFCRKVGKLEVVQVKRLTISKLRFKADWGFIYIPCIKIMQGKYGA